MRAGKEDEVRFALTAEAGLNEGLAFPFTYMAIAIAIAGPAPGNWIGVWLLVSVVFKLSVGLIVGLVLGLVIARMILAFPAETELAKAINGLSALAATLIVYGVTEYAGGYGFIAAFVAAVAIRNYERDHEYHEALRIRGADRAVADGRYRAHAGRRDSGRHPRAADLAGSSRRATARLRGAPRHRANRASLALWGLLAGAGGHKLLRYPGHRLAVLSVVRPQRGGVPG